MHRTATHPLTRAILQPGEEGPKRTIVNSNQSTGKDSTSLGLGLYAVVVAGGFFAYLGYQYLQNQAEAQAAQASA
jgi:hypothetical protein